MNETVERGGEASVAGRRALVTYASRHGSTARVAEAVAEALREAGLTVDLAPVSKDLEAQGYDMVVVGGPMIMGWHRAARGFVAHRRHALARVPTAYFMTAMALTESGGDAVSGVPVFKDPWLAKPPKESGRLGRRERYATPEHYLGDVLKAVPEVRPRAVAFFGGALDLTAMNLLERLFVMLVVGATPGDARNWKAIGEWSAALPAALSERV